jgi:hypothetical protein
VCVFLPFFECNLRQATRAYGMGSSAYPFDAELRVCGARREHTTCCRESLQTAASFFSTGEGAWCLALTLNVWTKRHVLA